MNADWIVHVLALLLICVVFYAMLLRRRPDLVDLPWFWAFAFSTVGLLFLWIIANKYDDREKRLEARSEFRERIVEQRSDGRNSRGGLTVAGDREPLTDDTTVLESGYGHQRQVPLRFLAGGLVVIVIGSGIMLWRTAMKPGRESSE